MGPIRKSTIGIFSLIFSLAVLSGPRWAVFAQDPAGQPGHLSVYQTRYERLADPESGRLFPETIHNPYAVWPEVELLVTLQFTSADRPVEAGSTITAALPEGLDYLPGSAVGPGTSVWVSTDGGLEFTEEAQRRKSTPGASGPGLASAGQARATHLRWVFPFPVDSGVRGFLRYRVVRGRSLAKALFVSGDIADAGEAAAAVDSVAATDLSGTVEGSRGEDGSSSEIEAETSGDAASVPPDTLPR